MHPTGQDEAAPTWYGQQHHLDIQTHSHRAHLGSRLYIYTINHTSSYAICTQHKSIRIIISVFSYFHRPLCLLYCYPPYYLYMKYVEAFGWCAAHVVAFVRGDRGARRRITLDTKFSGKFDLRRPQANHMYPSSECVRAAVWWLLLLQRPRLSLLLLLFYRWCIIEVQVRAYRPVMPYYTGSIDGRIWFRRDLSIVVVWIGVASYAKPERLFMDLGSVVPQ